MRLDFYNNCTGWLEEEMPALMYLCHNGREISYKTFLRHVDPESLATLATEMGYTKRLPLCKDSFVKYYSCKCIYYFKWSAIEYVFATRDQIQKLIKTAGSDTRD